MAGRKPRAPRARTHLLAIQRKLSRKGATKEEMIAALREQHPEIIRAEKDDIEHLGLMTIANSICNLKLGATSGLQIELFEGYDVPRSITLRLPDSEGRIQSVTKAVSTLTKAEARQYIDDHTKPPPKKSQRVKDLQRLLDYIGGYGEDSWTLKQCWKTAQAQAV